MTIPLLPAFFDMVMVKDDKHLSPDGYLYLDQQFQVLNDVVNLVNSITTNTVSNGSVTIQSLVPPTYTVAPSATALDALPLGAMWYNSTLKKLQFKSDTGPSVVSTITSVP